MKRVFLFGLMLFMGLTFTGCGNSVSQEEYDTLKGNYDKLEQDYNAQKDELEGLRFDYKSLQDAYGTLETDYGKLVDTLSGIEAKKGVIENGAFTFTPATFYDYFSDTMPDGYYLSTDLVDNPFLDGKLQIGIKFSGEFEDSLDENTGIVVRFDTTDPSANLTEIMLVSSTTSEPEAFKDISEWYLKNLLPLMDDATREERIDVYYDIFSQGKGTTSARLGDSFNLVMRKEQSEFWGSDYVIVIHLK